MTNDVPYSSDAISRRKFLRTAAAAGGGALIGVAVLASPAEAATKAAQKSVSYRPTPKGKQQCDNCLQWQKPDACKTVAGTIAPAGWCILYARKP